MAELLFPLLNMRRIVIVFALYFVANLVLVMRKEREHLPDKVTVFARRIHEEGVNRHLTQEEVAALDEALDKVPMSAVFG